MNNVQLDMTLGYLNEGTEIDKDQYMIESLNEMVQNCIYESTMITSLLEEDNEEEDEKEETKKKDIGIGTKIKETIKRFVNWIKSLVTKLKIKIAQLNVNMLSKSLDKAIAKQKAIAKNLDPDAEVKLTEYECAMFEFVGDTLDMDTSELSEEFADNDYNIAHAYKSFAKLPAPIVYMTAQLAKYYIVKNDGKLEEESISVSEYLDMLDELPDFAKKASKILDDNLKGYNDLLSIEKDLYKEDPTEVNKQIKIATKTANFITLVASGTLKLLIAILKMANKPLKNASVEK